MRTCLTCQAPIPGYRRADAIFCSNQCKAAGELKARQEGRWVMVRDKRIWENTTALSQAKPGAFVRVHVLGTAEEPTDFYNSGRLDYFEKGHHLLTLALKSGEKREYDLAQVEVTVDEKDRLDTLPLGVE